MRRSVLLAVTFAAWLGYAASKPTEKYDTVVVGLGSSGVTAASTLAKAGRRVLGLEANDRIGGRVKTVPFGDGVVEVGAEWIDGIVNSVVYDAAVQNNVTTLEQKFESQVFRSDGSFVDRDLFLELIGYGAEVSKTHAGAPKPLGQHITEKLMEYLEKNHPDVLKDQDYVNGFLEDLNLSLSAFKASTDWNEVSAQSSYEGLGGSSSFSWHKNGFKTFFEILLNRFNSGPGLESLDIKLNKEVVQIKWPKESTGIVEVVCKDGDRFTADNVIVTVSLGVLQERYLELFQPALPEEKIESIKVMSMGLLDKIIFKFDEPWWHTMPYDSMYFMWKDEDKKTVSKEDYWTTKIYGASVSMGYDHALTLFVSGENAKMMETIPEDVVKTKAMGVIRRFMGANFTIPEPTGMIRSTWFSNPFTRGSNTFDNIGFPQHPNARSILGEPLLDSAGQPKVLFAGEATNPTHFGTVHGASETGYREAQRLLPNRSGSKTYTRLGR